MSEPLPAAPPAPPYSLFDVRLARKTVLTPSLARLTFAGPDVARMAMTGPDQRIKIYFPDAAGQAPALPKDGWMAAYQALDPRTRWPRRTYTIRALRAAACEVDVDFVLHGVNGPASAWATDAQLGAPLQIIAPNAGFGGDPGGVEWRPPPALAHALLLADETALPAVGGILETLAGAAQKPRVQAFIEVPDADDRAYPLPSWPGLDVHWLVRKGARNGDLLIEASLRADLPARSAVESAALPDIDVEREILWDRGAPTDSRFYAWAAGEAGAIKEIRRILIPARGLARESATLMGYWRAGRALDA